MLKQPRLGGAAQLRLFVHEIGFERACRVTDVHPATMRRWLREAQEPPQAALQALYWLTHWGFSDACAETDWTHQLLLGKVRELEARLAWRAPAQWAAANEPAYLAPGLLLPFQA